MSVFVYVTISEEDRVSIFSLDEGTGGLEHLGDAEVPGRPAPLAMSADGGVLYAGRRDDLELSSYRIDRATGGLSLIGSASLRSDPCFLGLDRTGRYVLSAYYGGGGAAVHSIGEDGAAGSLVQWLDTDTGAHSIQTDPSNRFAFVPHIADVSGTPGPNEIRQLRFDEGTGRLSPGSPYVLKPEEGAGPRHFCFHPRQDVLYFSNEQGCSVTAYRLDTESGSLSAFQTVSTLPEGYEGVNSCAQIQITPDGRFLYAPNRGHDSIACFAVDPSTARLEAIGRVATEPVPRAIGLSPSGRLLFAAGLESGNLAVYRIGGDGRLSHLSTLPVGAGPMWVLAADIS